MQSSADQPATNAVALKRIGDRERDFGAMTLVIFFHPWIVLGLAIDAALLWVTLVVGWAPATANP